MILYYLETGDYMSTSRTKERENAMTIIYQMNLYNKNNIDYNINELTDNIESNFTKEIVTNVDSKKDEIDELANKYLKNWKISRLGLTDAAILRVAIYELLYTDTPEKVVINEAVELAKKYSDEKVVKMINATLDKIYHNKG